MRLHKYIASSGITSRRKAEEMILEGRVTVDGELITELGTKVNEGQVVAVDGNVIAAAEKVTVILNKPKGYITTTSDERGRPIVTQLLPPSLRHLKPVGRLDKDTTGLILLTSDGDFALRLTHPRYGIEKEYKVTVSGVPDEKDLRRLASGVTIEGKRTAPAEITLVYADPNGRHAVLNLVIHEGRKRQVRLMTEAVGHPTLELERVRIGHLKIKGMRPGEVRRLGMVDLNRLRTAVGLSDNAE